MRFETPGLASRSWRTSDPESVTADLIFFSMVFGRIEDEDRPLGRVLRLRHLALGMLQVHDPGADRRERRLRDDERVAEPAVEPDRDVARELDVLALVVADRDLGRVVQQDVGDHEHRVVEQPDAHRLDAGLALLGALVLELGHAAQLAEGGDAVEQPGELGVGADVALHEQQRAVARRARPPSASWRAAGSSR